MPFVKYEKLISFFLNDTGTWQTGRAFIWVALEIVRNIKVFVLPNFKRAWLESGWLGGRTNRAIAVAGLLVSKPPLNYLIIGLVSYIYWPNSAVTGIVMDNA